MNQDDYLLDQLSKKESKSQFEYDKDVSDYKIPDWIPNSPGNNQSTPNPVNTPSNPNSLGKAIRTPMGMESEWKNLPVESLPSRGFGYPEGFEIAIRAAEVKEIRQYSTVDEADRIDLDEKLNTIISKCSSSVKRR